MYEKKLIDLNDIERFRSGTKATREEVEAALNNAAARLKTSLPRFVGKFPQPARGLVKGIDKMQSRNRYFEVDMPDWTGGMWTGIYWMLYEWTNDENFRKAAESHLGIFEKVIRENIHLDDHDTGFKFTPSCVAAYRVTGNERAKIAALRAAEILLEHYCPHNNFIIRYGKRLPTDDYAGYRTLVDSMMNISLFFWAYEQTKEEKFYNAAVGHYRTTMKYLIREDGSSNHHYQFNPETLEAEYAVTWQGNSDTSCWSRGHSWLVYGYPMAYKYTQNEETLEAFEAVANYFLNRLPKDLIPYWDFDFGDGSLEPRDSSAAATAVCGLLEMSRLHPDSDKRAIYHDAAMCLLKALIDLCENRGEGDGVLLHSTWSKPHNLGIDTVSTYGDYFYIEALMRALKPEWEAYW